MAPLDSLTLLSSASFSSWFSCVSLSTSSARALLALSEERRSASAASARSPAMERSLEASSNLRRASSESRRSDSSLRSNVSTASALDWTCLKID